VQKPDFNFLEELEKIELAEDLFGKNFPFDLTLDNPRVIVDYFVLHLRRQTPFH
jgi:hypothetical protein